jgi:hypothetical protein
VSGFAEEVIDQRRARHAIVHDQPIEPGDDRGEPGTHGRGLRHRLDRMARELFGRLDLGIVVDHHLGGLVILARVRATIIGIDDHRARSSCQSSG